MKRRFSVLCILVFSGACGDDEQDNKLPVVPPGRVAANCVADYDSEVGGTCVRDADCRCGSFCSDGACARSCRGDDDCKTDEKCSIRAICGPAPEAHLERQVPAISVRQLELLPATTNLANSSTTVELALRITPADATVRLRVSGGAEIHCPGTLDLSSECEPMVLPGGRQVLTITLPDPSDEAQTWVLQAFSGTAQSSALIYRVAPAAEMPPPERSRSGVYEGNIELINSFEADGAPLYNAGVEARYFKDQNILELRSLDLPTFGLNGIQARVFANELDLVVRHRNPNWLDRSLANAFNNDGAEGGGVGLELESQLTDSGDRLSGTVTLRIHGVSQAAAPETNWRINLIRVQALPEDSRPSGTLDSAMPMPEAGAQFRQIHPVSGAVDSENWTETCNGNLVQVRADGYDPAFCAFRARSDRNGQTWTRNIKRCGSLYYCGPARHEGGAFDIRASSHNGDLILAGQTDPESGAMRCKSDIEAPPRRSPAGLASMPFADRTEDDLLEVAAQADLLGGDRSLDADDRQRLLMNPVVALLRLRCARAYWEEVLHKRADQLVDGESSGGEERFAASLWLRSINEEMGLLTAASHQQVILGWSALVQSSDDGTGNAAARRAEAIDAFNAAQTSIARALSLAFRPSTLRAMQYLPDAVAIDQDHRLHHPAGALELSDSQRAQPTAMNHEQLSFRLISAAGRAAARSIRAIDWMSGEIRQQKETLLRRQFSALFVADMLLIARIAGRSNSREAYARVAGVRGAWSGARAELFDALLFLRRWPEVNRLGLNSNDVRFAIGATAVAETDAARLITANSRQVLQAANQAASQIRQNWQALLIQLRQERNRENRNENEALGARNNAQNLLSQLCGNNPGFEGTHPWDALLSDEDNGRLTAEAVQRCSYGYHLGTNDACDGGQTGFLRRQSDCALRVMRDDLGLDTPDLAIAALSSDSSGLFGALRECMESGGQEDSSPLPHAIDRDRDGLIDDGCLSGSLGRAELQMWQTRAEMQIQKDRVARKYQQLEADARECGIERGIAVERQETMTEFASDDYERAGYQLAVTALARGLDAAGQSADAQHFMSWKLGLTAAGAAAHVGAEWLGNRRQRLRSKHHIELEQLNSNARYEACGRRLQSGFADLDGMLGEIERSMRQLAGAGQGQSQLHNQLRTAYSTWKRSDEASRRQRSKQISFRHEILDSVRALDQGLAAAQRVAFMAANAFDFDHAQSSDFPALVLAATTPHELQLILSTMISESGSMAQFRQNFPSLNRTRLSLRQLFGLANLKSEFFAARDEGFSGMNAQQRFHAVLAEPSADWIEPGPDGKAKWLVLPVDLRDALDWNADGVVDERDAFSTPSQSCNAHFVGLRASIYGDNLRESGGAMPIQAQLRIPGIMRFRQCGGVPGRALDLFERRLSFGGQMSYDEGGADQQFARLNLTLPINKSIDQIATRSAEALRGFGLLGRWWLALDLEQNINIRAIDDIELEIEYVSQSSN